MQTNVELIFKQVILVVFDAVNSFAGSVLIQHGLDLLPQLLL